ncbi:MAG: hypothetical protein ACR2O3_18155 [Rhizobiaceae bacterium]
MRFNILLSTSFIFILSTSNAYAYLDPGTGSILLQGLIGAVAGGLFIAKVYWAKFKSMVGFSAAGSNNSGSDVGNKK